MAVVDRGVFSRWVYALKPASWPKLLVPFVLGQALGVAATGRLTLAPLFLGLLFTIADLAFVVLLNDWGDREVDRIKRQMFPDGCSPKTIPDGILPAHHVLVGGLVAGVVALLVAAGGGLVLSRPWLGPAGLSCLAIFVAYTLPPLRLNYRGGGELLETVGVGCALPWLNAYAQSGEVAASSALAVLPGFVAMSLASAVASGLSDEASDRRGGKRTIATAFGNPAARRMTEAAVLAGALSWVAGSLWVASVPLWVVAPGAVLALHHLRRMRARSADAVTNAFAAQGRYKQELHHAIWRGAMVLAVLLVASAYLSR